MVFLKPADGLMIREEGSRSSVTEITPSLELGVAGDFSHSGRHQQAGGVAQPSPAGGRSRLPQRPRLPLEGFFCKGQSQCPSRSKAGICGTHETLGLSSSSKQAESICKL